PPTRGSRSPSADSRHQPARRTAPLAPPRPPVPTRGSSIHSTNLLAFASRFSFHHPLSCMKDTSPHARAHPPSERNPDLLMWVGARERPTPASPTSPPRSPPTSSPNAPPATPPNSPPSPTASPASATPRPRLPPP